MGGPGKEKIWSGSAEMVGSIAGSLVVEIELNFGCIA